MREGLLERIQTVSEERRERGTGFGRRKVLQASTTLAMMVDAPTPAHLRQQNGAWYSRS
jgi:hypothetical protein